MYDGAPVVIGHQIIEENWLEYLTYLKKQAVEDEQRALKRQEVLAEIDGDSRIGSLAVSKEQLTDGMRAYRYYDISVNSFWNWYVTYKIEV